MRSGKLICEGMNTSRINENDRLSKSMPMVKEVGSLKWFDTRADYHYSRAILEEHSLRFLHRSDVIREIVLKKEVAETFGGKGFYIERRENDILNVDRPVGFFIPGKNGILEYIGKEYNEEAESWNKGIFNGKPVIYLYSGSSFEIFFVYKQPVDGRRFVFDSSYNSNNIVPLVVGIDKEERSDIINKSLVPLRT